MSAGKGVALLHGIRKLADRYDVFIVDLWGTVHDGIRAYPGAVDALKKLKAKGKTVVLLSNAPRRAAPVAQALEGFGVTPDLYALLVTSGESVHVSLRDRPDVWHRKLHGPCWHLGPSRDRSVFDGLDIEVRSEPDGCGFCVATGTKMNEERVEDYEKELDTALALGLPMICANPDLWVPAGEMLVICAGAFAEYYASKGGDVFWHGKPHAPIYRHLFSALEARMGATIDPLRTIAIGDGIDTDIAGAGGVGLTTGLLVGGVHRPALRLNWRGIPRKKALADLIEAAAVKPDYVLLRFVW